jgi:excisionase family DNA binding protein
MTHDEEFLASEGPALLTIEQAAVRLQVCSKSVRKYIKEGHLQVIRLSERKHRISEADLEKFIDDMRKRQSK